MKKNEADQLFDPNKMTKETSIFLQKRQLNDLIDSRVSYQDKEENIKMVNKTEGKLKKNIFVKKEKEEIVFKVFKNKYTEQPEEDGDIYGPIDYKNCDTPDKMLGQIRYLTGFDWCNKDIIDQFLHTVEAIHIGKTGDLLFKSGGR